MDMDMAEEHLIPRLSSDVRATASRRGVRGG